MLMPPLKRCNTFHIAEIHANIYNSGTIDTMPICVADNEIKYVEYEMYRNFNVIILKHSLRTLVILSFKINEPA